MDQKQIIDRFIGKYSFLNNFYQSSIWFEGKQYKTCEHAYQASKTLDIKLREIIQRAQSPLEAKKLGQSLHVREDWEEIKIDIMRFLIKEKFTNPFLRHLLLSTGDTDLVMNNLWNEKFWGICRGTGQNWLG